MSHVFSLRISQRAARKLGYKPTGDAHGYRMREREQVEAVVWQTRARKGIICVGVGPTSAPANHTFPRLGTRSYGKTMPPLTSARVPIFRTLAPRPGAQSTALDDSGSDMMLPVLEGAARNPRNRPDRQSAEARLCEPWA